MHRVPDAVQRILRCAARRISSAPRRNSGALRSIRGTPSAGGMPVKKKARIKRAFE